MLNKNYGLKIARNPFSLILYPVIFCLIMLTSACRVFQIGGYHKLNQAEEYMRQGKTDQAIEAYEEHMRERLAVKNRPEWENPYFYYLIIGDIELGRDKVDQALSMYTQAENEGVHSSLISDRYRYVASWYENRNQLDEAMKILKKHRHLDPLLFDSMLDRIAKEIVRREEEQTLPQKTESPKKSAEN